jgi:hypothetical protein
VARSSERGERLSSSATFFFRFVLPALFAAGAVIAAASAMGSEPVGRIFAAGCAAVAFLLALAGARLKKVIATERGLVVSNYRREILVPWEQIASVRESRYQASRPITVHLRSATAFGERFSFFPYVSLVVVGDHPAAIRIRERAEGARTPGR